MRLVSGFLVLSLALSTFSWETANHSPDCELVLAQVVFRHGDRNPVNPYPNDPFKNESFWPEGYGQLTKIGKQEQFALGEFLRGRYNGFLSPVYSPYEIRVQSSSVDRAIMSAEVNLAGLYPPKDTLSQWNTSIPWQPIPVHSIQASIDNLIGYDAPCPRYAELLHEFEMNSDVMQRVYAENKVLMQLLAKHTGANITTLHDLDYALDALYIEKLKGMKLPPWTEEVLGNFGDRLQELIAMSFKVMTYTLDMQRLRGGPLLKEIIENMNGKVNGSLDTRRKMFMYSGHDTTVGALLNTLDMYNDIAPPYFSMVMIELHRNITSNVYFVEVMYRNSTTHEPYKMRIPGCDFSCDLTDFLDLTRSRIPLDWNKECMAMGPPPYDAVGIVVSAMLLFILVGLCIAVGLILKAYCRNKRRTDPQPPKYPYLHLQMEEGEEEGA